jgi:uncharacterized protein (TIGR02145 family)
MNWLVLCAAIFLLGTTACKKKSDDTSGNSNNQETIIPATTKIFSANDWNAGFNSYDSTSNKYVFNAGINVVDDLKVGDVIVSSAGSGYLLKITALDHINGKVVASVTQATIPEAMSKGKIVFSGTLTYPKLKNIRYLHEGVKVLPDPKTKNTSEGILFPVNVVIYDEDGNLSTTDDQIQIEGEFNLSGDANGQIIVDLFPPKVVLIDLSYTLSESLNLSTTIQLFNLQYDNEITLAVLDFTPIVLMTPLPVVIIPEVELKAGVNVNVQSNLHTGIEQYYNYTVGCKYENSQWSTYQTINDGFNFTPPTLNATAFGQAYLKPELSFKFWGVAAPYLNAKLYGEVDADIQTTPWWTLYAGLGVNLGVNVEIFGNELLDYEYEILDLKKKLAEAPVSTPPDKPSTPSPDNGSTDIPATPTLTWTCSDPDHDPLTFDIYFGENNPPPLMQSGATLFEYHPGTLPGNTKYYWYIVARDNHANEVKGDVWSFTTQDLVPGDPCLGVTQFNYNGKDYHTIAIGTQCWMKENLDFATGNSWCYDLSAANCTTYGRLYDYQTAQSACPSGWKVPSDNDWKTLELGLGLPSSEIDMTGFRGTDQGTQLKAGGSSGFEAMMGGTYNLGFFNDLDVSGYFWTSSSSSGSNAWARLLNVNNPKIGRYESLKPNGFSVRCLKNN